jgi:hypothetical protein
LLLNCSGAGVGVADAEEEDWTGVGVFEKKLMILRWFEAAGAFLAGVRETMMRGGRYARCFGRVLCCSWWGFARAPF